MKYKFPSRARQYVAANAIIVQWVKMMINGGCSMKGKTVRQWLRAAGKNSCVMHDNCDANLVFLEVLHRLGMSPKDATRQTQRHTDIWNAVTASEDRWLERAAKRVLNVIG